MEFSGYFDHLSIHLNSRYCIMITVNIIMSQSLLWRHIVLLTVGVYSSNYRVLYTIEISITRRFRKSVGPSVCPFVTLTKKSTPPSLLIVKK